MKKFFAILLSALMLVSALTACGGKEPSKDAASGEKEYVVGICNYVDDASLNQIVDSIRTRLAAIGEERGVRFKIEYDNCNADSTLMSQIISNFQANSADLMVAVATPVAMAMQSSAGMPLSAEALTMARLIAPGRDA